MAFRFNFVVAVASVLFIGTAIAQESPPAQQQRPRRAAPAEGSLRSGPLVTLEVVLINRKDDVAKERGGLPTAAELLEEEKQGKLEQAVRVRLSSTSGRKAFVQIGERVPTVSGRTRTPGSGFGRGGREPGADSAASAFSYSYSYTIENIGTLISATPQVEDGGTVMVELQVERSRLSEMPKAPEEDRSGAEIGRQKTLTLTSQSTLRLKADEPTLAQGYRKSAGGDDAGEFIVVIAHVEAGAGPDTVSAEGDTQFRVITLQNAKAADLATVLANVLGNRTMRIAVDASANTIVVAGTKEELSIAGALLEQLDHNKR